VPHTTRTDAAERQVVLNDMQDRVIDRDAAGTGVGDQESARGGVVDKRI
jgi:hypothetical protein